MSRDAWTRLDSRACSDHRILRVREDRYRFEPTGAERDYVVIEAPSWVNVVALTPGDDVVLIRQFRHGVRDVTLEIPGGMVDPGESPETAAVRELREETGYAGETVERLGVVWPNPAIQDNACHVYLVHDATPRGAATPDPSEVIEVVTRPLDAIPGAIRQGEIRHALVVAAFGLLGMLRGDVPLRARGTSPRPGQDDA